jgi:hypothetical protein
MFEVPIDPESRLLKASPPPDPDTDFGGTDLAFEIGLEDGVMGLELGAELPADDNK